MMTEQESRRLHFNEAKAGAPFPSMVVIMRANKQEIEE